MVNLNFVREERTRKRERGVLLRCLDTPGLVGFATKVSPPPGSDLRRRENEEKKEKNKINELTLLDL